MIKNLNFWSDVRKAIKDWGADIFENDNIFFKYGKTQKTAYKVKLMKIYINLYGELIVRFKYEDGTLGFFRPYVASEEIKGYFTNAAKKKILEKLYPPLERAFKEDKEIVDAYDNLVNAISRYVARRNSVPFGVVKDNFEKKPLISLEY